MQNDPSKPAETQPPESITALKGPAKRRVFLKAFKATAGNISAACEAVGTSRQTYYDWLIKFPKFRGQVKEVLDHLNDTVQSSLYRDAIQGNYNAQKLWLQRKAGWDIPEDESGEFRRGGVPVRPMNQKEIRERLRKLFGDAGYQEGTAAVFVDAIEQASRGDEAPRAPEAHRALEAGPDSVHGGTPGSEEGES